MRQTIQKIRQLAEKYSKRTHGMPLTIASIDLAFEAGYLAAVEHEKIPDDKLHLPKCNVCNIGELIPTGRVIISNPPWYEMRCNKCNNETRMSEEGYLKIDPKLIHASLFNK